MSDSLKFVDYLTCKNARKSISVLTALRVSTRVSIYSFLSSFPSQKKLPCKIYGLPDENAYCAKVSSNRSKSVQRTPGVIDALFDKRRYINCHPTEEIDDHKALQDTVRAARDTPIASGDA